MPLDSLFYGGSFVGERGVFDEREDNSDVSDWRKHSMSETPNNLAAYIWPLADLLRGDFKQSQYGTG
jgi:hypothetical protein